MRYDRIETRYYNTYYYAHLIKNVLDEPFAYLRTIHELFENDGEVAFFEPFPKFTALHKFAEFCMHAEFSEDLTGEQLTEVLRDSQKLLPVNYALRAHGIEHTSFAEWWSYTERSKDPTEDDLYDYFSDLILEESFERLVLQTTEEIFFLMFLNRKALANLNSLIAGYIKDADLDSFEDQGRALFAKDGVLKRQYIPEWARRAVFFRDRGICVFCRRDLSGLVAIDSPDHFDHIVPLALGGINDVTNLQLLCSSCNLQKGAGTQSTSNFYERWYPSTSNSDGQEDG